MVALTPTSNYGLWKTEWNNVAYIKYEYSFEFKFERENWQPYYFFGAFNLYWHYSFAIVGVYIALIHATQYWMRNRKPFNLKTPLILWNIALAIFSIIGTWRFGVESLYVLVNKSFIVSILIIN